ncbi:30S ribosomal protein S1 [Deferribacterales bacterium RsTz2092]|nr:30S ribosomal protein S1 [Deferribacterales bacterium]
MVQDKAHIEETDMNNFEQLLQDSLKQPTKGSTINGIVVQVHGDDVIVDAGVKTEGIASKSELPNDVKVGDRIELVVVGFENGGYMRLSSRMSGEYGGKDMKDAIVKVRVESYVDKKGFRCKIGDQDAFIPENHIDIKSKLQPMQSYIGKVLSAKVLKSGGGKHRSALVSHKEYLIDIESKERKEFLGTISIGDVREGEVRSLKEYGAFVSLGVADGFIHKSNIVWGRPRNPAKFMKVGDKINVKILNIDSETGKIELGLKQLEADPWDSVSARYPVGSTVKAITIGRRRNGYIAEIEPGIDALVPLEEMSWLKNAHLHINSKDVLDGQVLDYDDEHKRIILSVKMLQENPWNGLRENAPEGSVVTGIIKSITNFGIFVDFGHTIDGLVHRGDISWSEEPVDLHTLYKEGDSIEAKVISIDEERERISLGVKQLTQNPWEDISRGGKKAHATVTSVTKSGIEVELSGGLKTIISVSDLASDKQLDDYKVGDTIDAAVVKADRRNKSVVLSVKKLVADSERKEAKEYMKKQSDEAQGFGTIFADKLK